MRIPAVAAFAIPFVLTLCAATVPTAGQAPDRKFTDDASFTSLFDGKSLTGWVTKGGHYDGTANWRVEDGAITGSEGENHSGGLLYTERKYHSFIFVMDAQLDSPFDSGVFLRMAPQGKGAQVTLDYRDDGEVGAIYADAFLAHCPAGKAKWKKDAWNHVEIRCTGRDYHVEFWLNGELLTDYRLPAGSSGYAPTGLIGLQVHGNRNDPPGRKARFKNIRIRELPTFDPELFEADVLGTLKLTEKGTALGWKSLFDGRSIDGWEMHGGGAGVDVADGTIRFATKGPTGDLRTKEDFRDFELQLDFRIDRMANSGVFLRAARTDENPAFSGGEIQILDDFNWESVSKSTLRPYQFTGSLYGSSAVADRSAVRPLNTWNTYFIRYQGSRLLVELNGVKVQDADTFELPSSEKAFRERAPSGFIGLQRYACQWAGGEHYAWFRNLFVRKL